MIWIPAIGAMLDSGLFRLRVPSVYFYAWSESIIVCMLFGWMVLYVPKTANGKRNSSTSYPCAFAAWRSPEARTKFHLELFRLRITDVKFFVSTFKAQVKQLTGTDRQIKGLFSIASGSIGISNLLFRVSFNPEPLLLNNNSRHNWRHGLSWSLFLS